MICSCCLTVITARFLTFRSTPTVTRSGSCLLITTCLAAIVFSWGKWSSAERLRSTNLGLASSHPCSWLRCSRIARCLNRVVVPFPARSGIDFELDKAFAGGAWFEIQRQRALIERGVIGRSGQSRSALLFPTLLPVLEVGEVGSDFPNGILDHRAAIDKRHGGKTLAKVPSLPR